MFAIINTSAKFEKNQFGMVQIVVRDQDKATEKANELNGKFGAKIFKVASLNKRVKAGEFVSRQQYWDPKTGYWGFEKGMSCDIGNLVG